MALLCLPRLSDMCSAEPALGSGPASAYLDFQIALPPVWRVLQVAPVTGGAGYRVWTDTRPVLFRNWRHPFRSGETVLRICASPDRPTARGP